MDRQFDMTRNFGQWVSVPPFAKGRMNATDYVSFNWDSNFPVDLYRVIVESASNADPNPMNRYREIGRLTKYVELPDVHFSQGFGSHAKILVLPVSEGMPAFIGDLHRGSTYHINGLGPLTQTGHVRMERSGVV